jgi:hypothetical protein
MSYYSGYFRSLDETVDPNGQLYKVLIFTGYNPLALNTQTIGGTNSINLGPYPYVNKLVGFARTAGDETHPGELVPVYRNVPVRATELTMSDHPFVVNYVGDGLEKPYRCSSATVSFLQSSINTDFINSLGQGVLVFLLKWRNTIMEVDGHLEDTETGAGLYKHYHHFVSAAGYIDHDNVYWNDYYPWEYDNFCFDVEWAGFSTPTMLNTEYSHCVDKFSMECQDAFSTLQYTKFERTDQMETMLDTLKRALQTLGVYRKVYITNDVRFAPTTNDLDAMGTTDGTALKWMAHQQDNFFDEDGNPMDYRKLLENMMNYLGLTIIPEGDSLYIVNDHCIGDGHTEYKLFQFNNATQNRCWSLPAENPTYNNGTDVNIVSTRILGKDDFCGGSTQLSSDVMYNKAVVTCDEMRPDPILPEIKEENNIAPELPIQSQPIEQNHWVRAYNQSAHEWQPVAGSYQYLEAYVMRPSDNIDEIKLYKYTYDSLRTCSWNMPCTEVTDEDLKITHHRQYIGATGDSFPYVEWVQGVIPPPSSDGGEPGIFNSIGLIMDFGNTGVAGKTQKPNSISFKRTYILVGNPNSCYRKETAAQDWRDHDWDDKSTYWQPLLYIKSKPFLSNGKQYFNLQGTFKFFSQRRETPANPTKNGQCPMGWLPVRPLNTMTASDSYMYVYTSSRLWVWMKIKCGDYYLTSDDNGNYSWSTTEAPLKVYLKNDDSLTSGSDIMLNHNFSFKDTTRGLNGTCVKLPVNDGYADPATIEIWVDRPLGPCSGAPQSATIENFEVNIYSSEYVESRKRRNPDRDNTTYENVINSGVIEKGPTVDLIHSSCDTAGVSYAETVKHTYRRRSPGVHVYRTNPEVMNDGTGYYGIPEQNNINGKCNQYKTPTLQVSTEFFRKDTQMHTRVLWPTQLPGHRFIIDSMEIDYEYEQTRVDLIEAKAPATPVASGVILSQVPVNRVNQTRNYHRTDDIMFDGHIARRNPVTLTLATVTGNEVDDSQAPQYTIDTDNPIDGASRFNVDFATGQIRMTAPVGSGVSASRNSNRVRVTTN